MADLKARVMRFLDVRPSVAVHGLFILFGAVIAAFIPFYTLFLRERGLTLEEIGLAIAVMALARIVMNPVWGHLADTRYGRRSILQVGTVLAAVAALALFGAGRNEVALLATSALFAGVGGAMGPNIDAIALVHLGEGGMHGYGGIRAWESLSYALATLTLGFVLTRPACSGRSRSTPPPACRCSCGASRWSEIRRSLRNAWGGWGLRAQPYARRRVSGCIWRACCSCGWRSRRRGTSSRFGSRTREATPFWSAWGSRWAVRRRCR